LREEKTETYRLAHDLIAALFALHCQQYVLGARAITANTVFYDNDV
jgi:hypothetical protein